jgi:hypothetical protein
VCTVTRPGWVGIVPAQSTLGMMLFLVQMSCIPIIEAPSVVHWGVGMMRCETAGLIPVCLSSIMTSTLPAPAVSAVGWGGLSG